jgi:uncharacterized membrane protein YkoI
MIRMNRSNYKRKQPSLKIKQRMQYWINILGGIVKEVELEDEDGVVVYGVHVVTKDGKSYDVKVNAKTEKVVKAESDDENDNDQEKADD